MSKFWHGFFQAVAMAVQLANVASGMVPPHFQPLVAAVVGLAQAGLALYNHQPIKQ